MTKKEDAAPKGPPDDAPAKTTRPLDLQFGPTPSPPGSRLKRTGK